MAFMKKQQIDALWAHVHWLGVLADTGSYTAAAPSSDTDDLLRSLGM